MAHTIIGQGAKNVTIIRGDNNIVHMNKKTKEYVQSSIIDEQLSIQDLSIGSFNANAGTGRAYFTDLGRTVPFHISRHAEPQTKRVLSRSLDWYANMRPSDVEVHFHKIFSQDGRLKRIEIVEIGRASWRERGGQ